MVSINRELYSDDEITEILRRAAHIDGSAELDRAILERTASELGISPEAVQQAEAEFRQGREEQEDRRAFTRHKWQEFYEHLASYFAVNGFLFFLDFAKDGSPSWFWYPFLGWGIAILIHFASMFRTFDNAEHEKEFKKWRRARKKRSKA